MKNNKDYDFLFEPSYAEKVCANVYEEDKASIEKIIKLLEGK